MPLTVVQVMSVIRLKFATDAVVSKMVSTLLAMPKKMFIAYIGLQIKILSLPISFIIGVLEFIFKQNSTVEECPLQPSADVMVAAVRKIRNDVLMGINGINSSRAGTEVECSSNAEMEDAERVSNTGDFVSIGSQPSCDEGNEPECSEAIEEVLDASLQEGCSLKEESEAVASVNESPGVATLNMSDFTGNDLMWDIGIIAQKARYFAKCLREGDAIKIAAARKALEDYPENNPMPKTRLEYDRLMEEATNGLEHSAEHKFPKMTEVSEQVSSESSGYGEDETNVSDLLDKKRKTRKGCASGGASPNVHDKLTSQNKSLRRRSVTANKLEEVLRACSRLLKEISNLNGKMDKFVPAVSKMTVLESELKEVKRLLVEVEADRNEMRDKLLALQNIIKEEEEYLVMSCESGFGDAENSPDEA